MERKEVESSLIKSIGYEPVTKTLEVEFRSKGSVYEYYHIPAAVWEGLCKADSIGVYFGHMVRGKYEFKKLV
jgi:hypothetical protein